VITNALNLALANEPADDPEASLMVAGGFVPCDFLIFSLDFRQKRCSTTGTATAGFSDWTASIWKMGPSGLTYPRLN
jgi:hypothetical protein